MNEDEEEKNNKRQALEKHKDFYHSIVDQALEHVQLGSRMTR